LVKAFAIGVLFAIVDGLGQGNQAATAAGTAVSVLKKYASDSVVSLIKRCHRGLMMTRGAVMTLASVDLDGNMSWLGIGNVEGVLLRGDAATVPSTERLRLHGGLVGYQLPKLEARKVRLQRNDLIIFVTDGIRTDFVAEVRRGDPPQRIADRVLDRCFKGNDDGLILVVRYQGGGNE
jgi:negative regulator of sigma-B (phosphoserine phosphatase)